MCSIYTRINTWKIKGQSLENERKNKHETNTTREVKWLQYREASSETLKFMEKRSASDLIRLRSIPVFKCSLSPNILIPFNNLHSLTSSLQYPLLLAQDSKVKCWAIWDTPTWTISWKRSMRINSRILWSLQLSKIIFLLLVCVVARDPVLFCQLHRRRLELLWSLTWFHILLPNSYVPIISLLPSWHFSSVCRKVRTQ